MVKNLYLRGEIRKIAVVYQATLHMVYFTSGDGVNVIWILFYFTLTHFQNDLMVVDSIRARACDTIINTHVVGWTI